MKVLRLVLCLLVAAAAHPALAGGPAIGASAPTFQLTTIDGKSFSLADATKSNKAVVLVFIATQCPYSNAYNERMKQMAADFDKKGALFVGINSNSSEPLEEVRAHAKKHGLAFMILKDSGNKVADLYDAKHTPEAFIVDRDGKVRYHGRIDENYEDASKVASPDLKNAVDAVISGHAVARAETKAFGCTIKRV